MAGALPPTAAASLSLPPGRGGVQVSVLSYGAWVSFGFQFGVPEAKELISACYDAGVNL